jgi:uncharacterized membrane-anchored protein
MQWKIKRRPRYLSINRFWAGLATFVLFTIAAHAQEAPTESTTTPEGPTKAAWAAAAAVMQRGPVSVDLRDQAKLQLPDGYAFVPAKEGTRIMETMGNQVDARFMGLIIPMTKAHWFVTVDYEAAGYIKDDDAKKWDAKELLDNLKEGTEAGNERRKSMGIPAIEVTRWIESPTYDAANQRLVWSAELQTKGNPDTDPTINYNTYVLGREGYISMDLVTSTSTITTDKLAARELLAATEFVNGKRYADYNSSTDKVAAYGLAALVGGLAIKKLGLLAMIGVFIAKFAKIILIGFAAAGGVIAKFFKRDKQTESP